MKSRIEMATIRELYRVDNKYWRTGDVDILDKRHNLAKRIDYDYWSELNGIMRIVTQKHFPIQKFVDVITLLGWRVEDAENDGQGNGN